MNKNYGLVLYLVVCVLFSFVLEHYILYAVCLYTIMTYMMVEFSLESINVCVVKMYATIEELPKNYYRKFEGSLTCGKCIS